MDRDWLAALVSLGKIVALEHSRNGVSPGDFDESRRLHVAKPARIEVDQSLFAIKNLEYLLLVGHRIRGNLVPRQWRASGISSGGITDHSGEITNEKRDLMTEILELPHLVDEHGVPKMQIGSRRIEARLDS